MTNFYGFIINLLPSLGFVLAIILLTHIIRQRRSPTSTLAWLLAIVFIPYIGVPFYLIFGGRKMKRKAARKPLLANFSETAVSAELTSGYPSLELATDGLFPCTGENEIRLHSAGEQAYHAIVNLIRNAKTVVCVATFILGRDDTGRAIVAALREKALEGVKVFLLLDALGSVRIRQGFLAPLVEAGGQAAFFMPMLRVPFRGRANLRNHRKMVIADGVSAIVGGMNLAGEYMGSDMNRERWQDLSLSIRGPACRQLYDIFRSDWSFASGEELAVSPAVETVACRSSEGFIQVIASGPDVEEDPLREDIITRLFHSSSRVWIVTPYFVPDELLLESLCLAAKRGVDLRLVIPKRSDHLLADLAREGYLTQLQQYGASIFLYLPGMLHAKALIIDDRVAITGSANMDMRSLLLNYELALSIHSPKVIMELEGWMQQLMAKCSLRSRRKSHTLSFLEGISRLFAPLL